MINEELRNRRGGGCRCWITPDHREIGFRPVIEFQDEVVNEAPRIDVLPVTGENQCNPDRALPIRFRRPIYRSPVTEGFGHFHSREWIVKAVRETEKQRIPRRNAILDIQPQPHLPCLLRGREGTGNGPHLCVVTVGPGGP